MDTNLLWQGVTLMFVGMGTVFVFLTVLVLATSVMSRVIVRLEGVPAAPLTADGDDAVAVADASVIADAEEIAAITAAITLHRRRH